MENLKSYEITFIVKEGESSDVVKKILDDKNAKIVEEFDLGLKNLAYEIKKSGSGHFYRVVFSCERENLKKIDSELIKQGATLRHLIVCVLRKPKETGERIIPKTGARDSKSAPVIGKPIEKNTEIPELVKSVEQPMKIGEKEVETPVVSSEKVENKATAAEKAAKPVKKSETESKKRVIKKATKAEASELDKKLEELVKED